MKSEYLTEEELGYLCSWICISYRKEVGILRQTINHHIDAILTLCFWQPCNEVHRNTYPLPIKNREWLKQTCRVCVVLFILLTNRTLSNISKNIWFQPLPSEPLTYLLICLEVVGMSCHRYIVKGPHHHVLHLRSRGQKYPSLVNDKIFHNGIFVILYCPLNNTKSLRVLGIFCHNQMSPVIWNLCHGAQMWTTR